MNEYNEPYIPEEYKPLSAWAYFGYSVLYAIPIIGFICIIINSFSKKNINRRNFTRMFWCALLVSLIIGVLIAVLINVNGVPSELQQYVEGIQTGSITV